MKITYDMTANVVYLYLRDPITFDEATKICPCEASGIGAKVNLYFDNIGMLVCIEVLDARALVPEQTLREAILLRDTHLQSGKMGE